MKARKRKERLEQNRISARESRKRKKSMIEELQVSVLEYFHVIDKAVRKKMRSMES
jgi:hypothetical protein